MGQEQGRAGEAVRALCVPYVRDTYGLSRLITVSRNRCSTAVSCVCHVVPKLLINSCYRLSGTAALRSTMQVPPASLASG